MQEKHNPKEQISELERAAEMLARIFLSQLENTKGRGKKSIGVTHTQHAKSTKRKRKNLRARRGR